MIDVLVNGAKGRMGSLVAATLAAQDDLRPVALVDPGFAPGETVELPGAGVVPTFATLHDALAVVRPQVGVEFTLPGTVFDNVTQLLSAKVHTVVGTSGLGESHIDLLASVAASNHVNLFIGPNFALGAVLLMRFAQQAAAFYEAAEVVELHHDRKVDAPSGTALRTAQLIDEARRRARGGAAAAPPRAERRALAGPVHRQRARAQRAPERPRGSSGGPLRRRGRGVHPAPRLHGPGVVHARRAHGCARGARTERHGGRVREPVGHLTQGRMEGSREMKRSLGTVLTAMVTPFTADLQVDHATLAGLADHLLSSGSDGIVVAGTTGESPTLSDDEKTAMVRTVVEVARGRGTVVAATGSNDTEHSVSLTKRAEDAGADAVLVVTPYYNKPPERGLLAHFRAVAAATTLPVILYNIPGRCVVNLSPELLAQLAQTENIVAVKQANPDLDQLVRLKQLCDLGIYAGNDDMLYDVLAMNGWGGICVATHLVGERMRRMVELARAGDLPRAREIHVSLVPLFEALTVATNPIPVKAALNLVGREVGGLRLPLVEASVEETRVIRVELERQGLL